jgi:hypothetical protein
MYDAARSITEQGFTMLYGEEQSKVVRCCLEQSRTKLYDAVWSRAEQMCHAVWRRAEQMYDAARSRAEQGCTMLSVREQSRVYAMLSGREQIRVEVYQIFL